MKMTFNQTKLVELIMELELKAKEYKNLCKKLDELKNTIHDPNAKEYENLRIEFAKNLEEIENINEQLKILKEIK